MPGTFNPDTGGTLTTSLVSYYNIDEASGSSLADSVGSNTLTATGTTVVAGIKGNARNFNGSTDFLSKTSPIGLPAGATSKSISAWIKPTNTDPGGNIVTWGNGADAGQEHISSIVTFTGITYLYTDGVNANNNLTITGLEIPAAGVWSHFVFMVDNNNNWKYYLNAVLKRSGVFPTVVNTATATLLRVGRRTDQDGTPNDAFWPGGIDELGIWSKVLSQTEVSDLYNSGNGNTFTPSDFNELYHRIMLSEP